MSASFPVVASSIVGALHGAVRGQVAFSARAPRVALRRARVSAVLFLASALTWNAFAFAADEAEVAASRDTASTSVATAGSSLLTDDALLRRWVEERNPEVAAARARISGASAEVAGSRLYQNPELDLGVSGLTLGRPTPRPIRYGETAALHVGLSQTLELGKRGPRSAASTYRLHSVEADYRALLADKVSDARDALAQYVYLQSRRGILDQRLNSARQVLSLADARLAHGDISGTDHDRLALEEASVQRETADNQADLAEALARCTTALSASCVLSDPNSDLLDRAGKLPVELGDLALLVDQTPGVQSLELQGLAAQKQAELARARAIPDPTISVGYTRDWYGVAGAQPHTLSVGVSLPLAVFDSGYHAMRAASAEALAANASARALALANQGEIRGLLGRKVALESKLKLIVNDLLPRGQSLEASSQIAYQQGQLSLTDLVLVRRDLLSLRLDENDTRYQMFTVRNELRRILALDSTSSAAR